VANTLTGIAHYHEIPGEGSLDFGASFKALNENGFSGHASVELYHHVASWEKALADSFKHLSQYVEGNQDPNDEGVLEINDYKQAAWSQ